MFLFATSIRHCRSVCKATYILGTFAFTPIVDNAKLMIGALRRIRMTGGKQEKKSTGITD